MRVQSEMFPSFIPSNNILHTNNNRVIISNSNKFFIFVDRSHMVEQGTHILKDISDIGWQILVDQFCLVGAIGVTVVYLEIELRCFGLVL